MIRDLAKTCALFGALSMSACSALLDWNGYTGGVNSSHRDAEGVPGDVTVASDADDATQDATVGANDAPSSTADAPGAPEAGDVKDTGSGETGPAVPLCSPGNCGGCCNMSFCYGGEFERTCGTNGQPCQSCATGLVCPKGSCVEAPAAPEGGTPEGGTAPTCSPQLCDNAHLCMFFVQRACCKMNGPSFFSCGCQFTMNLPGLPTGCL